MKKNVNPRRKMIDNFAAGASSFAISPELAGKVFRQERIDRQ
ncbi:MAG TPA: hypothetical protein VKR32_02175 [Puia sp.]|nr:hypothetical protein [Puia sp.]